MPLHFQLGLDVPTSMVHKAQQVPRYLYFRVDRDYRFSRDTNPLINRRKRSFEQLVTIWIERASCLHIRRMATSSNSAIPLQLSLILSILDLWNFFFLSFFLSFSLSFLLVCFLHLYKHTLECCKSQIKKKKILPDIGILLFTFWTHFHSKF